MLIAGSPGTGKTHFVRIVAKVLGIKIITITGKELTQKRLDILVKEIKEHPHALVYFTELNLSETNNIFRGPILPALESILGEQGYLKNSEGETAYFGNTVVIFDFNPSPVFYEKIKTWKENNKSATSEQIAQKETEFLQEDITARDALMSRLGSDSTYMFPELTREDAKAIIQGYIDSLSKAEQSQRNISIKYTEESLYILADYFIRTQNSIIEKTTNTEPQQHHDYGIRPIIDKIEKRIQSEIPILLESDIYQYERDNIFQIEVRNEQLFLVTKSGDETISESPFLFEN